MFVQLRRPLALIVRRGSVRGSDKRADRRLDPAAARTHEFSDYPAGARPADRNIRRPEGSVLTYDKYLEPAAISQFALGSLAYGIVLAAWERGLGCVINGQGIMQSDVVREHADIPDDESIMICIAMGYPDDSFPANDVRSERADNSDFVRYLGF